MGFIGRSVLRREDHRLLIGRGVFVGDLQLPGMLHAAIVRSTQAHARIVRIDTTAAAALPGVVAVVTGAEVVKALGPVPEQQVAIPNRWKEAVPHHFKSPRQPILAFEKARHVGEGVAVVVARDRYTAEDAAALVRAEVDPLVVVTDVEMAVAPSAPLVHEEFGTNIISEYRIGKGDVEAAFRRAPRTLRRRFHHHRYTGTPMECRGVVAEWDTRTQSLTVWSSTQVVHWVKRQVATLLGIPESRVRCVAPDVGGGFGIKGHVYPEDVLLAYLAWSLGRPVKWVEDRREHFLCSVHSRDQVHDMEVAFDEGGRILAVRDRFFLDCGAWNPIGPGLAYNTAAHLLGPYKVDHYFAEGNVVSTNKVPNAPYRGAGRPEAVFAMERVVDLIAREVGREPAEVRARNMVTAQEMPYAVGIPYRDGVPIVYDSGDFPQAFGRALEAVGGLEAFRRRQREARGRGRYLGLGLGCYTEGTGAGPFEGATVRVDGSGMIHVSSGACPMGNGQETIYAQIAADLWKVPLENVIVTLADTAAIPIGFGSIASRSTVLVSAALHEASQRVQGKAFAIAANLMECDPADVELREGGGVGVRGVAARVVSLRDLARAAGPQWDHGRPPGVEAGLEATYYYEAPTVTWAYATHAAIVEVDSATGAVTIEKYAIVHDAGVLVNPVLAEAQVVGGAAQGLGAALFEDLAYDGHGQLLTGTFMDYAVPTAAQLPPFDVVHLQIPSPLNPFGCKGLGEGGAIAPPAAIANAVCDALAPFGAVEFNQTPVRREQIVRAVLAAGAAGW